MVVEEWLVGSAQDMVVLVQDLDQVGLEQEVMDQVEQEELEALELVHGELVLVDLDQEALVQVFTFAWRSTYMTELTEYTDVYFFVIMDQWVASFLLIFPQGQFKPRG